MKKINLNLKDWNYDNDIDINWANEIDKYYKDDLKINKKENYEIDYNIIELNEEIKFPMIEHIYDIILNIYNQNKNILNDNESFKNLIKNYNQFKEKNIDLEELKKDILIKIDDFYTKSNEIMNIKFNLNDLINEINNINEFLIKNNKKNEILNKIQEYKLDFKLFEENLNYLLNLYNQCKESLKFLNLRKNYNNFKKYKYRWEEILNFILDLFKNYLFYNFQNTFNNNFNKYEIIINKYINNETFINDINESLFNKNSINEWLKLIKVEKNDNANIKKIHNFLFNWYFHLINEKIQLLIKEILNKKNIKIIDILNQFILLNILLYWEGLNFYDKNDYNYFDQIITKIKFNFDKFIKFNIINKINRQDISEFFNQILILKKYKNILSIDFINELNKKYEINEKLINYLNYLNENLIININSKFEEILIKIFNQEYYIIDTNNFKISEKNELIDNLDIFDFRIFELTKYLYNIINNIFIGNKKENLNNLLFQNYIKYIINSENYFNNKTNYYIWSIKFIKNLEYILNFKIEIKKEFDKSIKDLKDLISINQIKKDIENILSNFINKLDEKYIYILENI